jgi:GT2 family glycosyltransferase
MANSDVFPRISVVICTRDRPESIGQTLESVAAQDYPDYDVLVVDQSRGDETRRLVAGMHERLPWLRLMNLDRPGLSRAYNVGIRHTVGKLLAFTDDDVVVPPTWLRNVKEAFAANPQVSLLYGQVLLPSELAKREGAEGVTPGLPIPGRRILDRKHGFRIFGMGANFAARRDVFDRIGGFDEVLGGGGPLQSSQDFDFAYRVFKGGESTLLEPDVVVYHYGFRSYSGDWQATMRAYGIGVGGFLVKHVRMGDLYAVRLLLAFLTLALGRVLKRCLMGRSDRASWSFLANILAGMRQSFRFSVDRQLRVYRVQP